MTHHADRSAADDERRARMSGYAPLRSVPGAWPLLVALALGGASVGCSVFAGSGPTPVAQGKYYASGHPEYDQFFLELYETQVEMAATPERLTSARHGLADGLGFGRELPDEAMIEHVRARVRDLSDQGRIMQLQVSVAEGDAPAAAVLRTQPATRDGAVRGLADPVEKVSNELLSLRTLLEKNTARFDLLEQRLEGLLDRAEEVFVRDLAQFHEVKRNLEDAKRVLAYMRERAQGQLGETNGLLDGLVQATDSSAGTFDQPARPADAPRDEVASPSPKKAHGRKGTGRPAASKPAKPAPTRKTSAQAPAAPKPAPKPAPSEPVGFQP